MNTVNGQAAQAPQANQAPATPVSQGAPSNAAPSLPAFGFAGPQQAAAAVPVPQVAAPAAAVPATPGVGGVVAPHPVSPQPVNPVPQPVVGGASPAPEVLPGVQRTVNLGGQEFALTPIAQPAAVAHAHAPSPAPQVAAQASPAQVTPEALTAAIGLLQASGFGISAPSAPTQSGIPQSPESVRLGPTALPGSAGQPVGVVPPVISRETVQAMSADQINANWDAISQALSRGQL